MPDGDERDQRIHEQARDSGVHVLPTDSYVGLNRSDAEERAKSEGRGLVDRTHFWTTRRRSLSFCVSMFASAMTASLPKLTRADGQRYGSPARVGLAG